MVDIDLSKFKLCFDHLPSTHSPCDLCEVDNCPFTIEECEANYGDGYFVER